MRLWGRKNDVLRILCSVFRTALQNADLKFQSWDRRFSGVFRRYKIWVLAKNGLIYFLLMPLTFLLIRSGILQQILWNTVIDCVLGWHEVICLHNLWLPFLKVLWKIHEARKLWKISDWHSSIAGFVISSWNFQVTASISASRKRKKKKMSSNYKEA